MVLSFLLQRLRHHISFALPQKRLAWKTGPFRFPHLSRAVLGPTPEMQTACVLLESAVSASFLKWEASLQLLDCHESGFNSLALGHLSLPVILKELLLPALGPGIQETHDLFLCLCAFSGPRRCLCCFCMHLCLFLFSCFIFYLSLLCG